MASVPVVPAEVGRAVIDPKSYGTWDPLLDQFDALRASAPVAASLRPRTSTNRSGWSRALTR